MKKCTTFFFWRSSILGASKTSPPKKLFWGEKKKNCYVPDGKHHGLGTQRELL